METPVTLSLDERAHWELVGARIGATASMIASMLHNGIPFSTVKNVVWQATAMNIKDFAEWNSKDVSRKDCLVIRRALKAEGIKP